MAAPASFATFPSELVDAIAKQAPPAALHALCRVDRRLYVISLPYLYATVVLNKTGSLVQFSETLISRPALSDWVKILIIECDEEIFPRSHDRRLRPHSDANDGRRAACATAIGGLKNLTDLVIRRPLSLLSLLPSASFPGLQAFSAKFSPHLPYFLDSHRSIESLWIPPMTKVSQFGSYMPRIHLPALREFTGPELVMRAVIPGSLVTALAVSWDPTNILTETRSTSVACLAQSAASITELTNILHGWDTLDAQTVCGLPEVAVLRFSNRQPGSSDVQQWRFVLEQRDEFIAKLTLALPIFPNLTTLVIDDPARRMKLRKSSFDWDWRHLNLWSSRCPTLRDCTLFDLIHWQRLPSTPDLWFPVDASGLARSGIFLLWFVWNLAYNQGSRFVTDIRTPLPDAARTSLAARRGWICGQYAALLEEHYPDEIEDLDIDMRDLTGNQQYDCID
ncbi:hypothetical protein FB451DRAFT_1562451 [Mycena latifolia]|nr:hypothetical protein FB451DRAFT_1562451 [Mycena latifolia]